MVLVLIITGCGSKSGLTPENNSTTMANHGWTITTTTSTNQSNVITVSMVPNGTAIPNSPGQVTSCNWLYTVVGPTCFTAIPAQGVGSLVSTDSSIQPLALIMGVPSDPVPSGTNINFVFVENYNTLLMSNYWVLRGTGTITKGSITGTWECDVVDTIGCAGVSGTFSGKQN